MAIGRPSWAAEHVSEKGKKFSIPVGIFNNSRLVRFQLHAGLLDPSHFPRFLLSAQTKLPAGPPFLEGSSTCSVFPPKWLRMFMLESDRPRRRVQDDPAYTQKYAAAVLHLQLNPTDL